jgi:hypothetical protein
MAAAAASHFHKVGVNVKLFVIKVAKFKQISRFHLTFIQNTK